MTSAPGAAPGAVTDNLRGMMWMLVSTLLFACMHAMVRMTTQEIDPFIVAFFRNLFGVLTILPVLAYGRFHALKTRRFGLHLTRAAINVVAMLCFFWALSMTPLADVAALSFTAPVFATVLAIFVLGERVRLKRWSAILFGFAGTIVILRPGLETVSPGALLVLASSVTWACALMIIKLLGRTESALTITTYMVVLMCPMSLVPALFVWEWPDWEMLGWLALLGTFGTLAQIAMTMGLKAGDTNVVMPMDFFKLVWAAGLGFVVFAEVPDAFVWLGGLMIFGSATYIAIRERELKKQPIEAPRSTPV